MPAKKRFEIETIFSAIDRVTRPINRMMAKISRMVRAARAGLRRLDGVVSKVAGTLARGFAVGAAVAATAIFGLKRVLDDTAGELDDLAKRTRRLEFPIEEFQKWRFVAEQAGVSTAIFDKSMDKFTRGLGEAKAGTGAMVTILKKMDPALLKQLKGTESVSDAFEIYLKAIKSIDDPTKKAALSSAAFGRAGADMIQMANLSAKEIEALKKEMTENGLVTQEQAESAEAYNDAMNSLSKTGKAFIVGVLTPLMPMLVEGANWLREWAIQNREIIQTKILEFGRSVVDNWSEIVKWAERIGKGVAVFFALVGVLKILIGVLTVVNAVMTANPIGLIIAGVIALIAAYASLVIWAEEIVETLDKIPMPIKVIVALLNPFIGLHWLLVEALAAVKRNWVALVDVLQNTAVRVLEAWIEVKNFFINLWNTITQVFTDAVNHLIMNGPISWMIAAVGLIMENWEPITEFFTMLWSGVLDAFTAVISPIVEVHRNAWTQVFGISEKAASKTKGIWGPVVKFISDAFAPLAKFFAVLWDGIVDTVSRAVGQLKEMMSPVLDFINGIVKAKDALVARTIPALEEPERTEEDRSFIERDESGMPVIVDPEERRQRLVEEYNSTQRSELVIKDETGRAEPTSELPEGMTLVPTGAF